MLIEWIIKEIGITCGGLTVVIEIKNNWKSNKKNESLVWSNDCLRT